MYSHYVFESKPSMSKAIYFFFLLVFLSCSSSSTTQYANSQKQVDSSETISPNLNLDHLKNFEAKKNSLFQNSNYGTITETGLILNHTEYKILIDEIDPKSLSTMPQMKISDESLYMPNAIITNSAQVPLNN